MKTIGLIGYGNVGRFLAERIAHDALVGKQIELAFAYNRSAERFDDGLVPAEQRLSGADAGAAIAAHCAQHGAPDLIVEVSQPQHVSEYAQAWLADSDVFVASLTALARSSVRDALERAAQRSGHGLYLPTGAAWGVEDIRRMDRDGSLTGLEVSMTFHADALRVHEPLASRLDEYCRDPQRDDALLLYEGNVAGAARLAPNNVNTMVCVALAGASVGVHGTRARLFAQTRSHRHEVEITLRGRDGFFVCTRRVNPAQSGAVTGSQTYATFLRSVLDAGGRGAGFHFC